jgi:hypothetical protein
VIRNEVLATPRQTQGVQNALALFAIIAFNALPIIGVALFGWAPFTALTLLCADLMILTMIAIASAVANAARTPAPAIGRIYIASILVLLTAMPLAMSADKLQAQMELPEVLAQSELAPMILVLAVSRVAQFAAMLFVSPRPWKSGVLNHPLFAMAVLLWFWRPGDAWVYPLLLVLCLVKAGSEIAAHFADATARHEATWLTRARTRLGV